MTIISRMTETSCLSRQNPDRRAAKSTLRTDVRREPLRDRLLDAIAPIGYEDELGFHYGMPPQQLVPVR